MDLLAMGQGTCAPAPGGTVACYVIENQYIDTVAVNGTNQITGVTVSTPNKIVKYVPNTQEDKPFYNQKSARAGTSNKITQDALYVFAGLDNEKRNALQAVTSVDCGLTVFHVLDNGEIEVQGIEWNDVKNTWKFTRKPCVAEGDFDSNTSAGNQEVTVRFKSETAVYSSYTTMTEVAIAAL